MCRLIYLLVFLIVLGCKEKTSFPSSGNVKLSNDFSNDLDSVAALGEYTKRILQTKYKNINRNAFLDGVYDYSTLDKNEKFLVTLRALKQMGKLSNDSLAIADVYRFYGRYFLAKGVLDSSFFHYNKAIKLYKDCGVYTYLPHCYFNLSSLQIDILDYWNAQLSAIKCYEYAGKVGNKQYQVVALLLMGMNSYGLKDYNKALDDEFRALELMMPENDEVQNKESCYNNIGAAYQGLEKHDKAIEYFKKGLSNSRLKILNPGLYATLITNIAYSKMAMHKYKHVESELLYALTVRKENHLNNDVIASYNILSQFHAQIADTLKSKRYNSLAIELARSVKDPRSIMTSLVQGCKVNKKEASYFSQEYIKMSDSIEVVHLGNQNKFARIAFETDEITTQKDKAIKQKWIVLIVGSTLFLLGVLLFIIKMQRAKQKELILIHEQQKSDESIYQLIQDQQIKIDEGRQAEKKRISLELHDGVMNKLTSTRLNLFILNKKQDDETIKKCLKFIDDIQNIEKEIRKVAHDLSDDLFSGNKSFNLVLQSLFNQQKAMSSTAIHPEIDPAINWEIIDNSVKMNLYRILQEILNNCNKYASANNIFITISKDSDGVFTHTHDDGNGFDVNTAKKGIGLKNIAQRVQTLNGKLTLYSQPNEGTTISFFLSTVKSVVNP